MTGDAFVQWMETWRDIDKWELHEGQPVAMTGGTARHDIIASNIDSTLRPLRKRDCRAHRDILLRSPANDGFGVFPDVYVRCGPVNDRKTWLDDAVAVFEVLSPSTMRIDRGYKFEQYSLFPTIKHICMVYQNETRLEMWTRDDAGEWIDEPTILRTLDETLHLSAFELDIPMAEIYADTELAASASG
jgi:Uma2 family endonuclease